MTRIIVAGIGGVGGYFGGLLARRFDGDDQVQVSFIARGAHLKEIQTNGLKVITKDETFIARPAIATDQPAEAGIADYLIICTKGYDLETIIQQLRPCINKDTIMLPLLNGVNSKEQIEQLLQHNVVLNGCVYIVSRLKQAGVVENSGNLQLLYFGSENCPREKLILLESLLRMANIEAFLSEDITRVLWEKFIFVSPTATATSYFNRTIGELLAGPESLAMITALIEEVKQLAVAKQILISEDLTEKVLDKLRALPFDATSSMHADFKSKRPHTELQSLTGFVVLEAQKQQLKTPMYLKAYEALSKRG